MKQSYLVKMVKDDAKRKASAEKRSRLAALKRCEKLIEKARKLIAQTN